MGYWGRNEACVCVCVTKIHLKSHLTSYEAQTISIDIYESIIIATFLLDFRECYLFSTSSYFAWGWRSSLRVQTMW